MTRETFSRKLVDLPAFQEQLRAILQKSVAAQFRVLGGTPQTPPVSWSYLLSCGSVLATSAEGRCQDAAFRIAQACLHEKDATPELRAAAGVVLDTLTNVPAIALAKRRRYLDLDFEDRLPMPLRLEVIARSVKYSIEPANRQDVATLSSEYERLNSFQLELWRAFESADWISASAPTSAGKSHLLARIVQDHFAGRTTSSFGVYLVPTRALVQEVEVRLSRMFLGSKSVRVSSLPRLPVDWQESGWMFVLTQERYRWLLNEYSALIEPTMLVVDEAQKIGDGARGVLLQNVIEATVRQNPSVRLVFASPMTTNPGLLVERAPGTVSVQTVMSEQVAVNQNLLWASQRPRKPREWGLELVTRGERLALGSFSLASVPVASQRLPFVAHALGRHLGGSIVYVNGPVAAEKAALVLYDLCSEVGPPSSELSELIDLVETAIHPKYVLARVLSRGIAFHYGNMPLLVRTEIETLFKEGHIRFLVCTSTLVEGVNLPAKSIFLRSPAKGNDPLDAIDFWNLAGRAGRQGHEFQGNVVCVDAEDWKTPPPSERVRYPIARTIDTVATLDQKALLDFVREKTPRAAARNRPDLEHSFVYFLGHYLRDRDLSADELSKFDLDFRNELERFCETAAKETEIPEWVVTRNPGVSPFAARSLLQYFHEYDEDVAALIPAEPGSNDAFESYTKIVARIASHLSGDPHQLTRYHALLVVRWMQGLSLRRIIEATWAYWEPKGGKDLPMVIRDTMADVEQFARFSFPKFLACYCDVLRLYYRAVRRPDLEAEVSDLSVWLDFGASRATQLALMALGLSRTTAVAVSELIAESEFDEKKALEWLRAADVESLPLNSIIKKEVLRVLETRTL